MPRKKAAASADPNDLTPATSEPPPPSDTGPGDVPVANGTTEQPPTPDARPGVSGAMPALGRGWTQRFEQPVKYAHSTFKDPLGKEWIAFRFDLPPGVGKPDDAVLAVMRDHKYFKDGRPNGLAEDAKSDSDSYSTGLRFDNLPRGGKAWLLPNTPLGRTVADSLDQALDGLAKRIEGGVGGPG